MCDRVRTMAKDEEKEYWIDSVSGRIIAAPAHGAMKPGWRVATADDIAACAAVEAERAAAEAVAKAQADEQARAESHERGLEEKAREAENAVRMAAKHAAVTEKLKTVAGDSDSE